jgi:hypothetical protein
MIAKLTIGTLLGVVLVMLYRGMLQEQAELDPTTPPDIFKIQAVLRREQLPCDEVISFMPLGKSKHGWDSYLARCRDGQRHVFFQHPQRREMMALSCTDQARRGYRCPK